MKSDEFVSLDGSGLCGRDLVTPSAIVQLLTYASRQAWGPAYEDTLPVSGVDGSLAERFLNTPAAGWSCQDWKPEPRECAFRLWSDATGKKFVFSIFCNNHNLPASKVLATIDAIVQLLVKEGDATVAAR